jgi:hypothetical protein
MTGPLCTRERRRIFDFTRGAEMTSNLHHSGKLLSRDDPTIGPAGGAIERVGCHEVKTLEEASEPVRFGGSGRAFPRVHDGFSKSGLGGQRFMAALETPPTTLATVNAAVRAVHSPTAACGHPSTQLKWLPVMAAKRSARLPASCHSPTSTANLRPRRRSAVYSERSARATSTHDGMIRVNQQPYGSV